MKSYGLKNNILAIMLAGMLALAMTACSSDDHGRRGGGGGTGSSTIDITNVADGASVGINTIIRATASNPGAVTKVEFYVGTDTEPDPGLNTNPLYFTATSEPYQFNLYTGVGSFIHGDPIMIRAKVYCNDGGSNYDIVASLIVDNMLPSIDITAPTAFDTINSIAATITTSAYDDSDTGVDVDRVELYVDEQIIDTVSSGTGAGPYTYEINDWDTTTLSHGNHTVKAVVYDAGGNSTSDEVTVVIDNGNPAVEITSPASTAVVNGDSAIIKVNASDNDGIAQVALSIDGPSTGSPDDITDTDNGVPFQFTWDLTDKTDGDHEITVTATDDVGNFSSDTITVAVDRTAPSVNVTAPANGATVSGSVTVSAIASDNDMLAGVKFYVDGALKSTDTASPYSWTWNTAGYDDGGHSVRATAYDAGGLTTSSTVNVTVDNEGPYNVKLVSPQADDTVSGTVTLGATAQDYAGAVDHVEFWLDGTSDLGDGTLNAGVYELAWNSASVPDGEHGMEIRAYDDAGNETINDTATFWVDNTDPATVSITSPAASADVSGTVNIEITASDSGIGIDYIEISAGSAAGNCYHLGGTSYEYQWDTTPNADGTYAITATAYDLLGGTSIDTVSVDVDNTPPSAVNVTSPANGAYVAGTIAINAAATGASSIEFYIDGSLVATDGASPYSYSWATTSATNGQHSIRIIAYDAAGNATIDNDTTVIVDNTAPTVAISNPAGSSYLKGTVNISAAASDNSAIDRVVFNIGGGAITQTDTTSPYEYSWITTTPGNGSVTITATAYDEAGGSDTDSITVTVDNTAPNSSAVAISPITTPNFLNDNDLHDDVTVQATASDGQTGIAKVRFSINEVSGTHDVEYTDLSSPYEYTWSTTLATFPNGEYTISITAYDYAGNTTTTTTGDTAVTVDNTNPATGTFTIVDNDGLTDTGDFITYASVNLTSSATDNVNVYQMRFSNDNAAWSAWEAYNTTRPSAWDMTSATYGGANTDGTKTVYVQYRDNAGNYASTSDTIFLDRVNPTADAGTALLYYNTATALNGTSIDDTNGADDSGVESRLWTHVGGTGSGTVTFSDAAIDDPTFSTATGGADDGTYNLQFWVRDNAGRTATDTATIHWDTTNPTAGAGADMLLGPNSYAANPLGGSSSDGGTNPSGVASRQWTNLGTGSGTGTVSFSDSTINSPTFQATGDGTYNLRFTVTDNATNSSSDYMTVTWDQTAPTVSITAPATGSYHNSAITLTANSSDTHAMTYQWTASPATASFANATAEDTTCTPTVDGTYTLTLTVTDAVSNSNSASITVYWDTTPPVIDAGTYSTMGASFALSPTVTDAIRGVDPASYSWTVTGSPSGSTEHGMPSTSLAPSVWMDVDGSYTLQLAASDLLGNGPSSDTATITWDRSITDGTLTSYGQYSSLATVRNGTTDYVFVSYYDAANSDLRMACLNGNATASPSVLPTVGVDGAAGYGTGATTNDVGMYNDIEVILDGTTYYAYIVYYDNTASAVKMARGASTNLTAWTWTVYTIDAAVGAYAGTGSLSIAAIDMGADHQAYVSYYDAANGYLMSGRSSSTDWTYWITATIDSTSDVGRFSSNDIYTVSGDIRSAISYSDVTAGNLKYAIAPQATTTITVEGYTFPLNYEDDYFIIYDGTISYGIWATYEGSGSQTTTTMGTDYAYSFATYWTDINSPDNLGPRIVTVLNGITGTPFSASYNSGSNTLTVTHNNAGTTDIASESNDSFSGVTSTNPAWSMPAAITTETTGADGHSSLVLNNSSGTAHAFISYYNATDGQWYLTHGVAAGTAWTSDTIEAMTDDAAVNERSSVYVYWDGSAYDGFVSYYDSANDRLKFASGTGAGATAWTAFTTLTVDAGTTVGQYNSIGGYYTGTAYNIFIGYYDDADAEAKFTRSLDGGASW